MILRNIQPLFTLLSALRKQLIVTAVAVTIGMGVAWNFAPSLLGFLEKPLSGQTYLSEVKKIAYLKVKEHYPSLYTRLNLDKDFFISSGYLKNDRLVVIKEGARGVSAYSQTGRLFVPAFNVHSVDGTGAGDSFAGGLLFALARGDELEAALRLAGACGALTAAVLGPQAAFGMPEIETLLR